jgi:hypothetical protein
MREDRAYRSHFRARVDAEAAVPNPWRGESAQASQARPSRVWREEGRPGMVSIMGYALAGLCLASSLAVQAFDLIPSEAARGAAIFLSDQGVQEQLANAIAGFATFFRM